MVGGVQSWQNQIPYLPGWWLTGWRTIIPKKFLHYCEGSKPHVRLPSLGIWKRDQESPGNLAFRARRIWLQAFHRTGGQTPQLWRAQTKFCMHQDPEERSSDSQETEPKLPASVGGPPVETWGGRGSPHGQGHWKVPFGVYPLGVRC